MTKKLKFSDKNNDADVDLTDLQRRSPLFDSRDNSPQNDGAAKKKRLKFTDNNDDADATVADLQRRSPLFNSRENSPRNDMNVSATEFVSWNLLMGFMKVRFVLVYENFPSAITEIFWGSRWR